MRNLESVFNDFYLSGGALIYGSKDGSHSVRLNQQKGWYEIDGEISSENLKLCLSNGLDYNEMTKSVFGSSSNTDLGLVQGTYLVQSCSEKRAYEASSGGGVKEVLHYLFDNHKITSAIAVQRTGKLKYEPIKIKKEDVDSLPQSIYHCIDTSLTVKILKDSKPDEKFAIVGSPWQIDDLNIYIKNCAPELRNRVYLTVGLISGWFFSLHSVKALCHYYDINYEELFHITYRGKGKKGMIRFYSESGKLIKEVPRFNTKSRAASDFSYNLPAFLLYANTQNMLADVVMGDPHLLECDFSKPGLNLSIARSSKGDKILGEMSKSEYIKLYRIDDKCLIRSQKRERLYGDFAYSYIKYLNSIGIKTPNFVTPGKDKVRLKSMCEIRKVHKRYLFRLKLQRRGAFKFLLFLKYWESFLSRLKVLFSKKPRVSSEKFENIKDLGIFK